LSFRDLGYRWVHMLAEALRLNTQLTGLDLNSNQIGPSGAIFIAHMLWHPVDDCRRHEYDGWKRQDTDTEWLKFVRWWGEGDGPSVRN
jgi:hypothetical protein